MNLKRLLITAAFILVAGLGAGTAAQSKINLQDGIAPPIPFETTISMELNAIEVTDGLVALDPKRGDTMFGYGFLGRTSSELPGSFMLSMNCFPAVFLPGEGNEITGGMWTLPVYMSPPKGFNTVYMGSFYGTVGGGKMGWDKEGNATVFMTFNVDGGTQTWNGVTGSGFFEGTLTETGKGPATLTGKLTITYR